MKITNIAEVSTEIIGAWKCIPESERDLTLMADVAVDLVLSMCVQQEGELNEHSVDNRNLG